MENVKGKYKVALKLATELEQSKPESIEDVRDVVSLIERLFWVKAEHLAQESRE